jgi:hypothetical protein
MQDLQNNNEYTFTRLDSAAIKFESESHKELHVVGTLTHISGIFIRRQT